MPSQCLTDTRASAILFLKQGNARTLLIFRLLWFHSMSFFAFSLLDFFFVFEHNFSRSAASLGSQTVSAKGRENCLWRWSSKPELIFCSAFFLQSKSRIGFRNQTLCCFCTVNLTVFTILKFKLWISKATRWTAFRTLLGFQKIGALEHVSDLNRPKPSRTFKARKFRCFAGLWRKEQ